jgi:glycosyltransferase involved in cell wall biosynthesis
VSFVLPAVNRSGGVRVTVIMANLLLRLGRNVRLVAKRTSVSNRLKFWPLLRHQVLNAWGASNEDWVRDFRGPVEYFTRTPEEVGFDAGEIVIAVGTRSVDWVTSLRADVIKMRYCHGFAGNDPELNRRSWSGSMPTIVVSEGLVDKFREQFRQKVYAVVPNGIDSSLYYEEDEFPREGIGTVFNLHYNKAPEFTTAVMNRLRDRLPHARQFVFGNAKRPAALWGANYVWYPSIEKARELYNRCKVWIVSSRIEGFCLPMLEAMACGCAVVTTNHDGCPGLMKHGENCFVVPFGDLDAIEEHVALLYENDELRQRIVEAGRETIKRYTWDTSARRMEECLTRIAAERGGSQLSAPEEVLVDVESRPA